jgi:hypothetical protein
MYLDCDTTPALRGQYIKAKRTETAVRYAKKLLGDVAEGQIGIYDTHLGNGFHGYVIKLHGEVYFEAAE